MFQFNLVFTRSINLCICFGHKFIVLLHFAQIRSSFLIPQFAVQAITLYLLSMQANVVSWRSIRLLKSHVIPSGSLQKQKHAKGKVNPALNPLLHGDSRQDVYK